jgi:SAM-dependent methyltransferase
MRRLHSVAVTTAGLPERLQRFGEVLSDQAIDSAAVRQQIASIQREMSALQPAIASIQRDIGALRPVFAATADAPKTEQNIQLQAIREEISTVSKGVTRLGGEIDSLRSVLASEFLDIQRLILASAESDRVVNPLRYDSLQAIFGRLEAEYPRVFPVWKRLFENSKSEYTEAPVSSLSVVGHAVAPRFGEYILEHGRGTLLDIGCGPQSFPIYLSGYPVGQIAGMDPLQAIEPHPFVFCQAIMEEIPWPDRSFQTVVAATSLDHALDLPRALGEIDRVLLPSGRVLIWVGFVEGGRFFDPHTGDANPVDKWHLFHFDQDWFEALMLEYFLMSDRFKLTHGEYFYSFRKRGRAWDKSSL